MVALLDDARPASTVIPRGASPRDQKHPVGSCRRHHAAAGHQFDERIGTAPSTRSGVRFTRVYPCLFRATQVVDSGRCE